MAVDTATELLFLDTFKHQSAEVRRRGSAEGEKREKTAPGKGPAEQGGFLSLLPAGSSGLGDWEVREGDGVRGLRVVGLCGEKEPGGAAAAASPGF